MSLFVSFILAAVLLGAGAMLSPAWRTAQPRVALAATLCLGLVVGGAVFYAEAFSWDTLVVDYLLFALLSGVVLGGTLSTAQARAEARGERLDDRDQGWPGPGDLTLFAFAALLLLIPLLHQAAPEGEAGQIVGFHSLAIRDGGSFHSLAPFHLDEPVIVSPGFHALAAYLSAQLDQPIPLIQFSAAAVLALLTIWLAYDFGRRIERQAARARAGGFDHAQPRRLSQLPGRTLCRIVGAAVHGGIHALRPAPLAPVQPRRSRRRRSDDGRRRLHQPELEPHHLAELDRATRHELGAKAPQGKRGVTLGADHRPARRRATGNRALAGQ